MSQYIKSNFKNQTILITGGLGFIGKSLAKAFVDNGVSVCVLDNKQYGDISGITNKVKFIYGDVRSSHVWNSLPKCDYIYHLAAPSSIILFNKNAEECIDITITGLKNCFEWAKKNNINKVIFPSSGSIFTELSSACNENTLPKPVNSYGKTKLTCEYIAKIYDSVPSTALRIFAGYGPQENHKGDIASVITLFYKEMLLKNNPIVFGDGNQTRDFVYIDDIVETMVRVAHLNNVSLLNVGSGSSTSFNKVIEYLNESMKTNIKPKYIKKPINYLENTKCDNTLMRKIIQRDPINVLNGIKLYLNYEQNK